MAYKSLLTIITDVQQDTDQLDAAIALARHYDAHLDIMCLAVEHVQASYYYAGATAVVQTETLARAQKKSEEMEAAIQQKMSAEDIRWAAEAAVGQVGGMSGMIALRARFSDLVVHSQPYGKGKRPEEEAIVEAALFEGRAPVLIVPEKGLGALPPRRVVVAWNQSEEALMAIRAAMPVLKTADHVDVTIIDPPSHGPERSDPGGALSQQLARHGVKAEVSVLSKTMPRISEVLCRHVNDISADMVVMGAYGHSRFREAILGGATRNMLETAEVPVLMAH